MSELFPFYVLWGLNFVLLSSLIYVDARRAHPASLLWLSAGLLFLVPSIADGAGGSFGGFGRGAAVYLTAETIIRAQLFAAYVLLAAIVVRLILWFLPGADGFSAVHRARKLAAFDVVETLATRVVLAVLVGAVLYAAYQLIIVHGGGGWAERREVVSGPNQNLINIGSFFLSGFLFYWAVTGRRLLFVVAATSILASFVVLGGTRMPVIMVTAPFLAAWISSRHHVLRAWLLWALSPVVSTFFDILLILRYRESLAERLSLLLDFRSLALELASSERTENSLRHVFYYYLQAESLPDTFFSARYLLRTFLAPIPTGWGAGMKPPNFEYDMHYAFTGDITSSMHPTFFGTLFADVAWFAPLWVIALGIVLYAGPLIMRSGRSFEVFALYGTLAVGSVQIGRGSIYGAILAVWATASILTAVRAARRFILTEWVDLTALRQGLGRRRRVRGDDTTECRRGSLT